MREDSHREPSCVNDLNKTTPHGVNTNHAVFVHFAVMITIRKEVSHRRHRMNLPAIHHKTNVINVVAHPHIHHNVILVVGNSTNTIRDTMHHQQRTTASIDRILTVSFSRASASLTQTFIGAFLASASSQAKYNSNQKVR
jgi:hypothetical protein